MKFNYSIIFLYFEYIRYFLRKKKQIAEGIVVLTEKKKNNLAITLGRSPEYFYISRIF